MSKTRAMVLDPRVYRGETEPPASLEDESRYRDDGVFTDVTWVKLPSGRWLMVHNDTTSVITIPHSPSITFTTEPFSLLSWATPSDVTGSHYLAWKGAWAANGWGFGRDGTAIRWWDYAGAFVRDIAGAFSIGVPAMVGFTKVGTALQFYVNGVAFGAPQVVTADLVTNNTALSIGHPNVNWYGDLGATVIYNYALSATAIYKIYQAERRDFGV